MGQSQLSSFQTTRLELSSPFVEVIAVSHRFFTGAQNSRGGMRSQVSICADKLFYSLLLLRKADRMLEKE